MRTIWPWRWSREGENDDDDDDDDDHEHDMHNDDQEAFAVCKVFLGNPIKKHWILNTRDSVSCGEFEIEKGKYLIKKGHEASRATMA